MQTLDLDRMCRNAENVVKAHVDFHYRRASRAVVEDFRAARSRCRIAPIVLRDDLLVDLPTFYRCPECGGNLQGMVREWNPDDGRPTDQAVSISCRTLIQSELLWKLIEELPEARRYAEYLPETTPHFYLPSMGWEALIARAQAWVCANVRVAP